MIEEIRIRSLGVIEDVTLALGPGLTVLTGETGAGKTMVLSALDLLFGGRADSGRVRAGADQSSVEGRVRVEDPAARKRVDDLGGAVDDDQTLILRRVVNASGRSRAAVGGAGAPAAVLAELAESLLVVHGQADQLRLTRSAAQRGLLDAYAGIELNEYTSAYRAWITARDALSDRVARLSELRRENDLLRFGLDEIAAADPQPGEDDELAATVAKLGQVDALRAAAAAGHDALLGSEAAGDDAESVGSLLGAARRIVGSEGVDDPELAALGARLVELGELVDELGRDFARYGETLAADPEQLEAAQQRRAELNRLARKYADTVPGLDGVFAWQQAANERLAGIDVSDAAIAALSAERDAAAVRVQKLAAAITRKRTDAARRLGRSVTAELAGLAMAGARFGVEVRPRSSGERVSTDPAGGGVSTGGTGGTGGRAPALGTDGADEVEFQLATQPDQPPRPLARSASGGELSRVMLALEVCLAGADPVPTMIFDEVDAGVGGRAATEVGARLKRLASARQVLVVTHLAQVAAYADTHVVVDKQRDGAVIASDVRVVEGDDRVAELARMLGGSDTRVARTHAEELLSAAR